MHDVSVNFHHSIYGPSTQSFDDTTIAFQYLAGLEYAITDSLSSKVGYRFLGTSNAEDQGYEASYRTHGIDFGLLYYF